MFDSQVGIYCRFVLAPAAAVLALAAWQADPTGGRSSAQAHAAAADDPKADAPKSGDKAGEGDAEAATPDRYRVPETQNSQDLLKFIDGIRDFEPETIEEAQEHQKQAPIAVKAAARRILKFEKDKSSEAYKTAGLLLTAIRISSIKDETPAEQRALIDEVIKPLSGADPSLEDFRVALMLAQQLDSLTDTKLAADAYLSLGKAFKASQDKRIVKLGSSFEGAARRVDLVGKPMKIEGHTPDGKPFDWKAYRGKVVLVDFWATWCGPCRAELPNVKQAYEDYHSRGFDVVGVSIDDDADEVKQFLAKEELPWTTLLDQDTKAPESHPLADYYGVMAIPMTILVGKDGNVITMNVRGEELGEQLAKLLAPATKAKAAPEKPANTAPPKPATGLKPKVPGK